jgi:long-chain acyl-CoA synthetase
MAIGDRRPFVTALIAVAPEVKAATPEDELVRVVQQIVDAKNRQLAQYEQVKRWKLLPADLTQETGELTPSLKVKRKVVSEKYGPLIEDMYGDSQPRSGGG